MRPNPSSIAIEVHHMPHHEAPDVEEYDNEGTEDGEDGKGADFEACGQAVLDAVSSGDAESVGKALYHAFTIFDEKEDEEEDGQ